MQVFHKYNWASKKFSELLSSLEMLYDFLDFDSNYLETDEKLYAEVKIEK